MTTVALIPARGGSVRLPGKNIKLFHGKPILAYSIETARKSGLFDRIFVSTDDHEISVVAAEYQAEVLWRPKDDGSQGTQQLAADILHDMPDVDAACVIYATAPLLTVADLHRGYAMLDRPGVLFSMAVNAEPLFDAGAMYWGRASAFREASPLVAQHTVMVPLPPERVCDINVIDDWLRAEQLFDALRRANADDR